MPEGDIQSARRLRCGTRVLGRSALPGDTTAEVQAKAFAWLDAGTTAVLGIDPATRTATVYRRRDDIRSYERTDVVDLADAVPGWRLSLRELFG